MPDLSRELAEIAGALRSRKVRYAVVGGLAVTVRAEPRFTQDVDLAVTVASDAEAEHLVADLCRSRYSILAVAEQEATGRLTTVRLRSSSGGVVDLLFASSGIESEVVASATAVEVLPRVVLPVASVGHLIAMKLLSVDDDRRIRDRGDLVALRDVATDQDWDAAATGVALIEARGAARGRDLTASLARLRRHLG